MNCNWAWPWFIGGLCLLLTETGIAATPTSSSLLKQQQQVGTPTPTTRLPTNDQPTQQALPAPQGQSIVVTQLNFSGQPEQITLSELHTVTHHALGSRLDFNGLQALTQQVTDYLKSQGWVLARAYLPNQDITEGIIHISIVNPSLSREGINISATASPHNRQDLDLIRTMAEQHLQPGQGLHESQLDQAIMLLNDLPGINVRAQLTAGQQQLETQLNLKLTESPSLAGNYWFDNYGNINTGSYRANLHHLWQNPTGKGDQGQLRLTTSRGTDSGQMVYSRPLGIQGNRLQVSYAAMDYKVVTGTGLSNRVQGQAYTAMLASQHPIKRSRLAKQDFHLTVDHLRAKDYSLGQLLTHKDKLTVRPQLSGNRLDTWQGGGLNTWNLGLSFGDLSLLTATNGDSYDTAGSYSKLSYHFSRLQQITSSLSLYASIRGQHSHNNLDAAEQFSLGGPNAIRAYPIGEASGDRGQLSQLEMRYDLPNYQHGGRWQLKGFYDYGQVQLHTDDKNLSIDTATGSNHYSLKGYGLGITLSQPKNYQIEAIWAAKQGTNPGRDNNGNDADGHSNKQRFWLQANFWY